MSENLIQLFERVSENFRKLSSQQKIERLKEIGILNKWGHLAERYGGSDEPPSEEKE